MMQRFAIVSAVLVLAACSTEQPEVTEPEEVAEDFVTANGSPPGVYEFTGADGSVSLITVNADGSFSQMTPDGEYGATGTLEVVEGRTCARLETTGAEPLCYTESEPAEDGSFTTTPDGGEPIAVRPISPDELSEGEAEAQDTGDEMAEASE